MKIFENECILSVIFILKKPLFWATNRSMRFFSRIHNPQRKMKRRSWSGVDFVINSSFRLFPESRCISFIIIDHPSLLLSYLSRNYDVYVAKTLPINGIQVHHTTSFDFPDNTDTPALLPIELANKVDVYHLSVRLAIDLLSCRYETSLLATQLDYMVPHKGKLSFKGGISRRKIIFPWWIGAELWGTGADVFYSLWREIWKLVVRKGYRKRNSEKNFGRQPIEEFRWYLIKF